MNEPIPINSIVPFLSAQLVEAVNQKGHRHTRARVRGREERYWTAGGRSVGSRVKVRVRRGRNLQKQTLSRE